MYEFFVSGLSVFESHAYAVYAIGSMLRPGAFALGSPDERRRVNPKSTVVRLESTYPQEPLTQALRKTIGRDEFKELGELRNTLAHRTQPGRTIVIGGASLWGGEPIADATRRRLDWINQQIGIILPLTTSFVERHTTEAARRRV